MKSNLCAAGLYAAGIIAALIFPGDVQAQNRYVERPPVLVNPDRSAPWVQQLRQAPAQAQPRRQAAQPRPAQQPRRVQQQRYAGQQQRHAGQRSMENRPLIRRQERPAARQAQQQLRTATISPRAPAAPKNTIHPKFLPQVVSYDGPHGPGTVIVDTRERLLYLVLKNGKARRYGVGVGKPGFQWAGNHKVTAKREWPDWRPPAEMIAREKKKGRVLPTFVKGGPQNPLGARALYLGSTLYRIHGTNQPSSIGGAVSSGCIRMRNEDVIDLYERVPVGAKVVVM